MSDPICDLGGSLTPPKLPDYQILQTMSEEIKITGKVKWFNVKKGCKRPSQLGLLDATPNATPPPAPGLTEPCVCG